jgi:hypothetical protein
VSLFTLQWSEGTSQPRADFSHEHQCVDWEVLNAWAGERAVPEEKMKNLQHPRRGEYTNILMLSKHSQRECDADKFEIGPAFADGHGSRLGASEDHSPTIHEHPSS